MANRSRNALLLVFLCAGLFFRELDGKDLFNSHEARAAQDAQQMLDDHSWGLPRLYDGQADLQKPPGYYWLTAGLGHFNGGQVDALIVRLPPAISATITIFAIFFFLQFKQRPRAAFFASAVLASAIHFTGMARVGRIDMPLTCAITLTLLLLHSRSSGLTLCAALPIAAGLLLKGPVAVVLPFSVWTSTCLASRWIDSARPRVIVPILSGLLGCALALPWFIWANAVTSGDFFRVFFWYHNYQRAMGGTAALGTHPWWSYFPRFAIDFLPWTPAFLLALWRLFRERSLPSDGESRLGLVWFIMIFAALSCSSFKRADYLLPCYPGAALFLGCRIEKWLENLNSRKQRWLLWGFCAILAGCCIGWWGFDRYVTPHQEAVREQRPFANKIRELAPAPTPILLFRVESHLLVYHLGRPVHTLVEWGEINDRLRAPGTHYFVTRSEFVSECKDNVKTRRIEVVLRSEDYCRERPLRPLVLIRTLEEATPSCPSTNCPD